MHASFCCRTELGELVEFTHLPMGYKCSPEILNTITRVFSGEPELVMPQYAAPKKLKIQVWIDDTRISGPYGKVKAWGEQVLHNMQKMRGHHRRAEVSNERIRFHRGALQPRGQHDFFKPKDIKKVERDTVAGKDDGERIGEYGFTHDVCRGRKERICFSSLLLLKDSASTLIKFKSRFIATPKPGKFTIQCEGHWG
ncbi:putative target of rapamycin (TOR) kinase 1 [Trypanosoma theileri]|uniref:Putative target of rapamycin (TOR) kinase 1 n=1 Tax=Trypanosoma theileri TaxID=67003 RepID=A0A1X0NLK1_9TRYP|nr:putative target of rapamycin (TOR) kinase 1 [Trypanosoma theileri]ORC85418.1 putative target of rapamycin (TOR) kinase 1 [Trypanosoma theileri]